MLKSMKVTNLTNKALAERNIGQSKALKPFVSRLFQDFRENIV